MDSVSKGIASFAAGACGVIGAAWIAGNTPVSAKPAKQSDATVSSASLCNAGEKPLFSCAIGAKQVAICDMGGQAIYRYGRPGRIELTSRDLSYASRGFAGGGETQVIATNKDYAYVVYDRVTRTSFGEDGRHDPAATSGLLIRRAGKTIAARTCAVEAPIRTAARQMMTAGAFVPH